MLITLVGTIAAFYVGASEGRKQGYATCVAEEDEDRPRKLKP